MASNTHAVVSCARRCRVGEEVTGGVAGSRKEDQGREELPRIRAGSDRRRTHLCWIWVPRSRLCGGACGGQSTGVWSGGVGSTGRQLRPYHGRWLEKRKSGAGW